MLPAPAGVPITVPFKRFGFPVPKRLPEGSQTQKVLQCFPEGLKRFPESCPEGAPTSLAESSQKADAQKALRKFPRRLQEGSHKAPKRFPTAPDGSHKASQNVFPDSFQKIPEGSQVQKVHKRFSEGSQKVPEGSQKYSFTLLPHPGSLNWSLLRVLGSKPVVLAFPGA